MATQSREWSFGRGFDTRRSRCEEAGSLYHLGSPVQVLTHIAAVAPSAYAVQRKRSVVLGTLVHMTLNVIATVTLMLAVFSKM